MTCSRSIPLAYSQHVADSIGTQILCLELSISNPTLYNPSYKSQLSGTFQGGVIFVGGRRVEDGDKEGTTHLHPGTLGRTRHQLPRRCGKGCSDSVSHLPGTRMMRRGAR